MEFYLHSLGMPLLLNVACLRRKFSSAVTSQGCIYKITGYDVSQDTNCPSCPYISPLEEPQHITLQIRPNSFLAILIPHTLLRNFRY